MRSGIGVPAPNLSRTRASNCEDASVQLPEIPLVRGASGFAATHNKATANPAAMPVKKTPSHFKMIANIRPDLPLNN